MEELCRRVERKARNESKHGQVGALWSEHQLAPQAHLINRFDLEDILQDLEIGQVIVLLTV